MCLSVFLADFSGCSAEGATSDADSAPSATASVLASSTKSDASAGISRDSELSCDSSVFALGSLSETWRDPKGRLLTPCGATKNPDAGTAARKKVNAVLKIITTGISVAWDDFKKLCRMNYSFVRNGVKR